MSFNILSNLILIQMAPSVFQYSVLCQYPPEKAHPCCYQPGGMYRRDSVQSVTADREPGLRRSLLPHAPCHPAAHHRKPAQVCCLEMVKS